MIGRIAALAACTIVAIGVVLAFGTIGTPDHQRLIAIDRHRETDLEAIRYTIAQYYASHKPSTTPARLGEITGTLIDPASIHDPVTGKAYGYTRESARRYELCATFALPSQSGDFYHLKHSAGHWCRQLDASI